MYSSKLSVSTHIMLLVATSKLPITSTYISESINTNPVVVRKLISKFQKAKLIEVKRNVGISAMLKDPKDINLLDLFLLVEPKQHIFAIHEDVNLECRVGAVIKSTLTHVYESVEKPLYEKLRSITLDQLIKESSL